MSSLWAAALVIGALVIGVAKAVIGDMIQEEARTRLGRIPFALIRLAGRRVSADMREDLTAEWTAELDFLLTGTAGMPLTRLARGIRYSAGLMLSAREITKGLARKDTSVVISTVVTCTALAAESAIMLGIGITSMGTQAITAGPTYLFPLEYLLTDPVCNIVLGGLGLIMAIFFGTVRLQAWRYKRWLRWQETTAGAMPRSPSPPERLT
jgi:hypothetical protein